VTREETARLVAVMVAATAQGSRLDGKAVVAMIDAYSSLLDDLPYDRCNAAVRVLLQSKPFIPAVAEIRAAVTELEVGPVRPGGDAWGDAVAAMKSKGSRQTPGIDFRFSDPVVARCVDQLGWRELCQSTMQTADRARFVELYDQLAGHQRREANVPALSSGRAQHELTAAIVRSLGSGEKP